MIELYEGKVLLALDAGLQQNRPTAHRALSLQHIKSHTILGITAYLLVNSVPDSKARILDWRDSQAHSTGMIARHIRLA